MNDNSGIDFTLITEKNKYSMDINQLHNKISKGNVLIDGPRIDDHKDIIKIKLKNHQKRIIYEMIKKEHETHRTSSQFNLNVLADKVGSGKSMDILSLIALYPTVPVIPENKAKYNYPYSYYSGLEGLRFSNDCTYLKTNILVVPHSIYHQWIGYLKHFPTIKYFEVKTKKDVEKIHKTKTIESFKKGEYQLILVKSTRYNDLICAFETICVTKIEDGENEYSDNIKNLNRLIQDIQKSIITVNERINNYNVFKNDMFDKVIKYANKLKEFDIDKLKEVNKRKINI